MRFVACKADVVQFLLFASSAFLACQPIKMRAAAHWKTSHHIHLCATSVITIKIELAIFAHKCAVRQRCHNKTKLIIIFVLICEPCGMRTVCMQNIVKAEAKWTRWASQFRFMTDWYIFRMVRRTLTHTYHWNYSVFNHWNIFIQQKTPFGLVLVLFCLKKRRTKQKIHASQLGLGQVEIKRHKLTEKIISAHCMSFLCAFLARSLKSMDLHFGNDLWLLKFYRCGRHCNYYYFLLSLRFYRIIMNCIYVFLFCWASLFCSACLWNWRQ